MADLNPVSLALKARNHQAELTETRIVDLLAIEALENGTANQHDLLCLCYKIEMTHALGRAGYLPVGMTSKELTALCQKALVFDVALLKQISDIHEAQTSACSATEYLKARQQLRQRARNRYRRLNRLAGAIAHLPAREPIGALS